MTQGSLFDAPAPATTLHESLSAQAKRLPADWHALLAPLFDTPTWQQLTAFVDAARAAGKGIFPHDVFHALHLTPLDQVRVVILGQDPYHGVENVNGVNIPQAHGLAFSVPHGVRIPPSLRNIYKEISTETGQPAPRSGNLEGWARQGVLLLNTVLTVEQGHAASHAKKGWEVVTDHILHGLSQRRPHHVFMLWGSHAQAKLPLLAGEHLILQAPHPSPLSAHRGFLGCGHFSKANAWLEQHGEPPIDWLATS